LNFIGKTKELLLAYPSMQGVTLQESVNVMLTPQFYTLKKESIPVKYAYQAKKIAPSLFEGLLEQGGTYDYMVFKEEDTWVFIAYDLDNITHFLASKGIEASMISKIFFAQQCVDSFHTPLALGEKEALVVLDDIVVVVPRIALGDDEQLSFVFPQNCTPKSGISLQGEVGSVLSKKQAYTLASIFVLFAIVFMVEGARYGGEGDAGAQKLQTLYEAYPALQSSYTREGIVNKYREIDSQEREKRDIVKTLGSMIFKGVTLTALRIDEKKFKAQFSCTNAQVLKRVKALAKKAKYNISNTKDNHTVGIEGSI
jgi:hypothetical protein